MANKPRRYWDACNFIAVINGEVGRAETCREIMREGAAALRRARAAAKGGTP